MSSAAVDPRAGRGPVAALRRLLGNGRRRRRLRIARDRAAWRLGCLQPDWRELLFDEHFLAGISPEELMRLPPREIALAWSDQFLYLDTCRRDRDIARATDVACCFVRLMHEAAAELGVDRTQS